LDNLIHNINALRLHTGGEKGPRICMPVKADAYGHGAAPVAKCALENGVSYLAVATVDEGIELRGAGIAAPVLLLSEALPCELEDVVSNNLIPFVSDTEYAAYIARAVEKVFTSVNNKQKINSDIVFNNPKNNPKKFPVFLKIDSGMSRLGCDADDASALARFINDNTYLFIAGCATHFAVSDSANINDIEWTGRQLSTFRHSLEKIKNAGIDPGITSAANTGAAVSYPDAYFDMVRPGILLYGYQDDAIKPALAVRPVMELVTRLIHIKKINAGDSVSYGRTWTAQQDAYIGVLPIGYADGLPRLLSGSNFYVVIAGKKYPLIGRICMDQCMIDLGPVRKVKRYDDVIIFGGGAIPLDAAGIAKITGTISYEITCNINKRVPRVLSYPTTPHANTD
jgi:alanine racemase